MKKIYQKILKACAPFEFIIGIIVEIAPIVAAFSLVDAYPMRAKDAFSIGILFYILYRPYAKTLESWRKEIC